LSALPPVARLALFGLLVAIVLAAASVGVQRHGPETGVSGAFCGPTGDAPCERPLLNGGFPVGFLYDRLGVPVEDYLALGEDQFRPLSFLIDVVFYFGLLAISWRFGQARRRGRAEARRAARGK
jgi:hypothetical protein